MGQQLGRQGEEPMEGVQECPVWHQEPRQGMGLGVEVAWEVGQEGADPNRHGAPPASHSPLRSTPGQARSVNVYCISIQSSFHTAAGSK